MRPIYARTIVLLLLTLLACQKNDMTDVPPLPDPPVTPVTAQLVLPEGSSLTSVSLTVTNGRFSVPVTGTSFNLDAAAAANTFSFVTDGENNPYLIKFYENDDDDDQDITPHSTAVALLLASPLAGSLTAEGRKNLVEFVTKTDEFAKLEQEIKNNLVQGRPITDSSNASLNEALLMTYEKMSAGGTVADTTAPLIIERNGKTVTIKNNGAANTYVAGVYRDGNQWGDLITIAGTERVAPSIGQAVSGLYAPYASPEQQSIAFEGDGNYQVRIRSGSVTADDNSDENALALKINIINEAWGIVERLIPLDQQCVAEIKSTMIRDLEMDVPPMSGSLNEVANMIFETATRIISENIQKASGCAADNELFGRYAETIRKFLSYVSGVSQRASGAINVTPRLFHLYNKEAKIDLCYSVEGDNVSECGDLPGDSSVYLGFHAVPGTTIGAAIEFRLHFKGSEVTGTATSISFDFGSGEQTVPVNGTLIDHTMTLFIHADNGVEPAWVDCVTQPAPHCATCRYTGDHVVQDWEITGTVNDDHSTYSAEYTRKFVYTSSVVGSDCNISIVTDESIENGALAY